MTSNGKLSFAFNVPAAGSSVRATAASAAGPAPKSNFELLMAKAGKGGVAAAPGARPAPAPKGRPALFEDEDDDESSPLATMGAGPSKPTRKPAVGQASLLSRSERQAQKAAEAIDQSIFDYDSHYEAMKTAERAVEEAKKAESEERKPKYIESFLASAQTRRLDKLRAEEKMLQREREAEGDEFEDKEKFVTEGYKKQMEEVRLAEEEEKKREEAMRKSRSGPGLTSFYKNMLDSDEAKHAAAVAATSGMVPTAVQGPSLAIRPPTATAADRDASSNIYDDEEEYDPFLAREAKDSRQSTKAGSSRVDGESGKQVEINDEGEVVDKRSLLKAGLNITKKPKPVLPNSLLTSQRSGTTSNEPYKSRAVGTAASYAERMERERKRLADQMREEAERKRRDEEERLRKEEEEARKRREGDQGDAERKRQEAKERFLARKRQREEEAKNGSTKKAKEDE
ncbi:hypothetical protein IAU60_000335 [Kwoniella sp. DSM 27419]